MRIKYSIILRFIILYTTIVTLYCSGSGLSLGTNYAIPLLIIANCLWLFLILLKNKFIAKNILHNNKPFSILLLIFLISFIFNFNGTGISLWLKYFLSIMLAALVTSSYSKDILINYYVKMVLLISVISLLGYFVFVILHINPTFMPIVIKLSDSRISYYSLGVYNIWISEFERNCGLFWEPSIFAAYLSIALFFILFNKISIKYKKYAIITLIITILTTKSTGGYLLLLIILLMLFWRVKKYKVLVGIINIIGLVLLIIGWDSIQSYLLELNYNIFSKIVYFSSMGSTLTRYYSALINFKIWLESPIIGVGLTEIEKIYLEYRALIPVQGLAPAQTSTSFLYLASFGIFGAYYTYAWIKMALVQKLGLVQKLLFTFLIMIIINQTPHTYFVLSYMLLFALINKNKKQVSPKLINN